MENENTEIELVDKKPAEIQRAVQIPDDAPLMTRMAMMMENGITIDVDQMAKMQEMSEQFEANEARKAFAAAFTVVQSEIEAVIKTKVNPQTHSKYAGLDGVIDMAKPVYTKQGFSIIYYEGVTAVPDNIRLCADVLHKAGHEKTYFLDIPLDGVGIKGNANMTKIHGKASSISYGRRYLMCMIWNIPTEDDDGNGNNKNKAVDIPFPTELEWECVDLIIGKLPDNEGVIDREKLAKWFLADKGAYPSTKTMVGQAAEYVVQRSPKTIYKQ